MRIDIGTEDKKMLCAIARDAIEARLSGRERRAFGPGASFAHVEDGSGGAFVTLRRKGVLRGCVGLMASDRPLPETLCEMAEAAAFGDPRFPPLARSEAADIDIEITLLGPMQKIRGADEIRVGRHGLYISAQGRSGVLLPQVAGEYGWDKFEFLDHVCLKAGLAPGAWQDPKTKLYIFEGIVFGEKD